MRHRGLMLYYISGKRMCDLSYLFFCVLNFSMINVWCMCNAFCILMGKKYNLFFPPQTGNEKSFKNQQPTQTENHSVFTILCAIHLYLGSALKSAGEESCPGPSGDGKGHHYSTLMIIRSRENRIAGDNTRHKSSVQEPFLQYHSKIFVCASHFSFMN